MRHSLGTDILEPFYLVCRGPRGENVGGWRAVWSLIAAAMGPASLAPSPLAVLPSAGFRGDFRCRGTRRMRVTCCCPAAGSSNSDSSGSDGQLGIIVPEIQRNLNYSSAPERIDFRSSMTGGAFDFSGATMSLTDEMMISSKTVTIVRHGLSSWNDESRVQGSSDLSVLTDIGVKQAEKCRNALSNIRFDRCFSSPISRAKSTAEVIWRDRKEQLVFLDSLKEAHLFFLEGMKNVDAKEKYPQLYNAWREDPASFHVNGVYPIRRLWGTAREAWKEILLSPGESFLVVTHKSILRALICTALGLGPERFRSVDINNGGITVFTINKRGEAMLQFLNMTAHMYGKHVYQY